MELSISDARVGFCADVVFGVYVGEDDHSRGLAFGYFVSSVLNFWFVGRFDCAVFGSDYAFNTGAMTGDSYFRYFSKCDLS